MSIIILYILLILSSCIFGLREFRSWSNRTYCETIRWPAYPFAYEKYAGQTFESKGRVNTNKQDFRHSCSVRGGRSKCNICEDIDCDSSNSNTCYVQLQGVDYELMSANVPVVTDSAWPVGGSHRHDYGGSSVTHFCVFLTGGDCVLPTNHDFSKCVTRCFGYGFNKPPKNLQLREELMLDVFSGMGGWYDDGKVDTWSYPRNCTDLKSYYGRSCTYASNALNTPSFNPQGFTFTVAGSTVQGFVDGIGTSARFYNPSDVAVDEVNVIYVADTGNNAIRMIKPATQRVSTIAGKGPDFGGFDDGDCSVATFNLPKGLDVSVSISGSISTTTIIVADTGNHRIRKIVMTSTASTSIDTCIVTCLSGLCGNNTLSAVDSKNRATPISGFADGTGDEARFSTPESVALFDGSVVVADTGNYLIRMIDLSNGNTTTLAGTLIPAQISTDGLPAAGCTPPCLTGEFGYRDGNLSYAQFAKPSDVARGVNNTIWVTDDNRIRIIALPGVITTLNSVQSTARVSTIAGNALQGQEDGLGPDSTFFGPTGVFVSSDNIAYVVDSATCKVRRITPMPLVAEAITCTTNVMNVVRPSGCTSFDQPFDLIGRKTGRVEANIQYNYGEPYSKDIDKGKFIKNCIGTPPHDKLDKHYIFPDGDNLVIDDHNVYVNEDSEQGTAIMLNCPANCRSTSSTVYGNEYYGESSSICRAAIHAGIIDNTKGGYIQITVQRYQYLFDGGLTINSTYVTGTTRNGIASTAIPTTEARIFYIEPYDVMMKVVHTIAGEPSAPLTGGCGYQNSQPPLLSLFNAPKGIAAAKTGGLSNYQFLYIADTGNNAIRAISAVCTQICENGGTCVGPDNCQCATGWTGMDCTTPVCTTACPLDELCVAPNTCGCKPGFSRNTGGAKVGKCLTPQCLQPCYNGGSCTAPDTCTCAPGWFDTNCTTPVCINTCANGGNCTAPNTCACPSQWQGFDCRQPVCKQTCKNNGMCVAPDTCICPPQWHGHDCSLPVCTQGYFVPNPDNEYDRRYGVSATKSWETYLPCNLADWCNSTKEFVCDQQSMTYGIIEVPSGPMYRQITGRKDRPIACMNIEINLDITLPYEVIYSDSEATGVYSTGLRRFSHVTPYTSYIGNEESGILAPEDGYTGPWTYTPDRQVANVNWLNKSEGVYVCANKGACIAPDTCECADGWVGFDCRTPKCHQGYYFKDQASYVSGQKSDDELSVFETFMQANGTYQNWPYSNPNYTIVYELYNTTALGPGAIVREIRDLGNKRYKALNEVIGVNSIDQGGYRCSIRSVTEWENVSYVMSHPNYYSRYMDLIVQTDKKIYSYWQNMSWPPVTQKSRVLDRQAFGIAFAYTNEGWRRQGIWSTTTEKWEYGLCIIEFNRVCETPSKEYDLRTQRYGVYVQDTDVSYRPRLLYNDQRYYGEDGRWRQLGGDCVDQVIRGCYNNGTCVAPDTCECMTGWTGYDCTTPVCSFQCNHHGNCTQPNQCTCEKGWSGSDCSIALCSQDCNNEGVCVAPDVCKCKQFENEFRDGSIGSGKPLFADPSTGSPLYSGWTGFDCSVPICVQSDPNVGNNGFIVNTNGPTGKGFILLGGRGGDGKLSCIVNGALQPRCPQYDVYVTGNDGVTFQTGCGYDPYDTGCCLVTPDGLYASCYKCTSPDSANFYGLPRYDNNSFYCEGQYYVNNGSTSSTSQFKEFLDSYGAFKICGKHHSPRSVWDIKADPNDVPLYYTDRNDKYSSHNYDSVLTSNRFLCNVKYWEQGDYIDNANLGTGNMSGIGSAFGLSNGRHYRINNPYPDDRDKPVPGEGVYSCYNRGSCIGPDICTCQDGYEGYDCQVPLCRHLQPTGNVAGCLNGGICISKDSCECIRSVSLLDNVHPSANVAMTGWSGSDCTMPMCSQGFYDPFCTDLPQAPGGEGCYRCSNGGNCTAPDTCTCSPEWTGFDCRTPVCTAVANPITRMQLGTSYEELVIAFEADPCGLVALYGMRGWKGTKYARGNCSQPGTCTCLCKDMLNLKACKQLGLHCDGPWQDPMVPLRNVLLAQGEMFTFGSTNCAYGYEGSTNNLNQFTSCHLTIYYPSQGERDSVSTIIGVVVIAFISAVIYYFVHAKIKRMALQAKIERRRSKRSSEESLLQSGFKA